MLRWAAARAPPLSAVAHVMHRRLVADRLVRLSLPPTKDRVVSMRFLETREGESSDRTGGYRARMDALKSYVESPMVKELVRRAHQLAASRTAGDGTVTDIETQVNAATQAYGYS